MKWKVVASYKLITTNNKVCLGVYPISLSISSHFNSSLFNLTPLSLSLSHIRFYIPTQPNTIRTLHLPFISSPPPHSLFLSNSSKPIEPKLKQKAYKYSNKKEKRYGSTEPAKRRVIGLDPTTICGSHRQLYQLPPFLPIGPPPIHGLNPIQPPPPPPPQRRRSLLGLSRVGSRRPYCPSRSTQPQPCPFLPVLLRTTTRTR